MKPLAAWLALAVLLCAAPIARSGEMRIPLARLVDESELVVVARVTSVEGWSIARTATAEVEEVWKGPATETLKFRAGALPFTGDVSWAVPNERVVLFLRGTNANGRWAITEFGHGRLPIQSSWGSGSVSLTPDVATFFNPRIILEGEYSQHWSVSFEVFEEQVRARLAALATLREELLAMLELDQRVRDIEHMLTLPKDEQQVFLAEGAAADEAHTARMQEIVAEFGWPGRTLVGEDAAHAAFVLVQHADRDPEFQASMLPVLERAAERGDVSRGVVAYLTDRVRVKQDRPQVYGTQYSVEMDAAGAAIADENGQLTYVLPWVEDVEQLDERRAEAGLGPWIEYEREMAAMQGREPAERPRAAGPSPPTEDAERDD